MMSTETTNAGKLFPVLEQKTKALVVRKPSYFMNLQVDPFAALLGNGLLERGALTSFIGIGGIGKSRLSLWMALCLITGRECCGFPAFSKPIKVFFLSTENGRNRWKSDLSKYRDAFTQTDWDLIEENLLVAEALDDEVGCPSLETTAYTSRLKETLLREKPDLIVLDPFADLVVGDENKNADITDTLKKLRQIIFTASPDAAVLIIHHARTGSANISQAGNNYNAGNMGRGGKALYSSVRTEIQLVPGDKNDSNKLIILCGKNNNGPKFEPRGIIFDPETFIYTPDQDFNFEDWKRDIAEAQEPHKITIDDLVQILEELCPNEGDEAKTGEILQRAMDAHDCSRRTANTVLSDAVTAKRIQKIKQGVYSPTP